MHEAFEIHWTADGSPTLWSGTYQQTYRSGHGAFAEVWHVFVAGTGVAARLKAGAPTKVLELGLGTGLSAFTTLALAAGTGTACEVWTLERALLPAAAIAGLDAPAHSGIRALAPDCIDALWKAWLGGWATLKPDSPSDWQSIALTPEVQAHVWCGEALDAPCADLRVNAVYLDGFAPAQNPDAWTPALLAHLTAGCAPDALLGTYSCAGAVIRALRQCGWHPEKVDGPPGGKHRVLRATRMATAATAHLQSGR